MEISRAEEARRAEQAPGRARPDPDAAAPPETILLRRLRFAAERLGQASRPAEVAAEALALAARFSGLRQGLLVRRARSGHFAVAARRDLGSCTEAERREVEAAAREVLARRAPRFDGPSDRPKEQVLIAVAIEQDGDLLGALVLRGPAGSSPLEPTARALLLGLARQTALTLRRLATDGATPPTRVVASSAAEAVTARDGQAVPSYAEARRAFERSYLRAALLRAGGRMETLQAITGLPEARLRALLAGCGASTSTPSSAPARVTPGPRRSATA
ncbi:MAG: hypothetical protein M9894_10230 [Planctomycetes bacterium]|nr:hypothetical protein [Planctomycetota bacterium]